jgi:hypothetical protein
VKPADMSSYPIVLTDKFRIITFSCPPTSATFDSAPGLGPMRAGRDWSTNGPIRSADSAKIRWQIRQLLRSRSAVISHHRHGILSTDQPAPSNSHTTTGKYPSTFASVQKSGKRSPSRPMRIFPREPGLFMSAVARHTCGPSRRPNEKVPSGERIGRRSRYS